MIESASAEHGRNAIRTYSRIHASDGNDDSNAADETESESDSDPGENETQARAEAPTPTRSTIRASAKPTDSIFVVMTDQSRLGQIHVNATMLDGAKSASADDDAALFDLPKRDEEDVSNDVSHVLLGGILIASPPRSAISQTSSKDDERKGAQNDRHHRPDHYDIDISSEIGEQLDASADNVIEESKTEAKRVESETRCEPKCDAMSNEVCRLIDGIGRCTCRPGFARIFPDRPCKRKQHPIDDSVSSSCHM